MASCGEPVSPRAGDPGGRACARDSNTRKGLALTLRRRKAPAPGPVGNFVQSGRERARVGAAWIIRRCGKVNDRFELSSCGGGEEMGPLIVRALLPYHLLDFGWNSLYVLQGMGAWRRCAPWTIAPDAKGAGCASVFGRRNAVPDSSLRIVENARLFLRKAIITRDNVGKGECGRVFR